MTDPEALQLILGPDKRNPCFCLYVDADEKELHVYYGLEVLEVVPNDPVLSKNSRFRLELTRIRRYTQEYASP